MNNSPLASILRPDSLEKYVGQEDLVGVDGVIRNMIESGKIFSMIFWGPPGSGKTTLARIISKQINSEFYELSAVEAGVKDIREVYKKATENLNYNKSTILFLDEIHRFNKAQQDALLPHVESGNIILIGATTENPSFGVISPLLSRCRVYVFKPYTSEELEEILNNAISSTELESDVKFGEDAKQFLIDLSNGDPRSMLNNLEVAIELSSNEVVTVDLIKQAIQKSNLLYDKKGEEHYNIISALHKSMRSSDVDASLYWLYRMLEAGDDPLYVARRLIRFASEDIGLTNNNALLIANAAYDTCSRIGMPECELALAQAVVYLAMSKKDNRLYTSSMAIKSDVQKHLNLPVPLHLRNAPTKLMKELDYGKGYVYDHNVDGKKSGQQCLPDKLVNKKYWKTP